MVIEAAIGSVSEKENGSEAVIGIEEVIGRGRETENGSEEVIGIEEVTVVIEGVIETGRRHMSLLRVGMAV